MASSVSDLFLKKHGRGPDKLKRRPRGSGTGSKVNKAVATAIKGKGSGAKPMLPRASGKSWQGRDV